MKGVASAKSNLTSSDSQISHQKPADIPKLEFQSQTFTENRTLNLAREVVFSLKRVDMIDPSVFDCNRIHIKANKLRSSTIVLINS